MNLPDKFFEQHKIVIGWNEDEYFYKLLLQMGRPMAHLLHKAMQIQMIDPIEEPDVDLVHLEWGGDDIQHFLSQRVVLAWHEIVLKD